jgi:hypothetical protein
MISLERRLAKLEEALQPQPVQPFCLLKEPPADAIPEAWEEHRKRIEEAKARGDFVAVVSSAVRQGDRPHSVNGVTYYASDFEARLVEASMLPSKQGNKSLLDDVFESLGGNVWGPVANPEAVEEDGELGNDMAM